MEFISTSLPLIYLVAYIIGRTQIKDNFRMYIAALQPVVRHILDGSEHGG